ncbi:leucine-rich repeat-containing protein 24-like [Uranotaenia lowii]|uniref:leucine-rich repeat-containing protein 24-like n=1 Tax=Uranotaenia lowii TaxID=190385 RepID=UPI00247A2D55|nr:leucine-rich repeat-containing protein 24-like [Uranotaenia lowii]
MNQFFDLSGWNLPALKELLISHNPTLKQIPNGVKNIGNLTRLYLDYNAIEHVQMEAFQGLHHLEILSLIGNGINRVAATESITLPQLQHLSLYRNKLTQFEAASRCNFPELQFLDLSKNRLTQFDVPMSWSKLQTVELQENPINCSWLIGNVNPQRSSIWRLLDVAKESCWVPVYFRWNLS